MNYRLVLAKLQIHKPQTYVNQINYRLHLAKLQNHKPQTYVNQMNYRLVLAKLRISSGNGGDGVSSDMRVGQLINQLV